MILTVQKRSSQVIGHIALWSVAHDVTGNGALVGFTLGSAFSTRVDCTLGSTFFTRVGFTLGRTFATWSSSSAARANSDGRSGIYLGGCVVLRYRIVVSAITDGVGLILVDLSGLYAMCCCNREWCIEDLADKMFEE